MMLFLQYLLGWNSTLVPNPVAIAPISASCVLTGLELIPPDPVSNVEINFNNSRAGASIDFGSFLTLEFSWSPPEFLGSGLQSYQIWLEERMAQDVPEYPTVSPLVFGSGITSGNLIRVYEGKTTTEFQLYFQVGRA